MFFWGRHPTPVSPPLTPTSDLSLQKNVCAISSLELETLDSGVMQQFLESLVPSPQLLMVLLILMKLASEDLERGTIEKNEYKENHGKVVVNQIQGNIIRKMYRRRARMLSLQTNTLKW